jgi:hypothetical protein
MVPHGPPQHSGLRLVESQRKPPKQVFFTVIALKNPVIGRTLPLDLKKMRSFHNSDLKVSLNIFKYLKNLKNI